MIKKRMVFCQLLKVKEETLEDEVEIKWNDLIKSKVKVLSFNTVKLRSCHCYTNLTSVKGHADFAYYKINQNELVLKTLQISCHNLISNFIKSNKFF